MLPRFLVPDLEPGNANVTLPREEAHHLHRVLRMRIGDEAVIFDGRGTGFKARVRSIDRGAVTVTLVEPLPEPPLVGVALTLVQSILKGDAMDDVVRDCTMVGVESVQPIVSERTTVKASLLPKAVERWRRVALASSKQCGRLRLPEVSDVMTFERSLRRFAGDSAFMLVEPSVSLPHTFTIRELAQRAAPSSAIVLIGPEGGWTSEERDLAIAAGWTPLSIGRLTLRAVSVPLAATAALLAIWDG